MVDIQKTDIEIKQSTIPELDQSFVDEILTQVPKNERDESFVKSKWFRDGGGMKYHKLQVLQAAILRDSLIDNQFDSMEKTINKILKKRVITLTTIGYGDFSPQTNLGKLFTMAYIIIGVALILGFVNTLFFHYKEEASKKRNKKKNTK